MLRQLLRAGCARWLLVALCAMALSAAAAAADSPRVRQSFNAGWRFHLGHVPGAEMPAFEDTAWQRVGLPHSFSTPYFQSPMFHTGHGWYRKVLVLNKPLQGRRAMLEFEGAFQDAEVFVNGRRLARHRGGYTAFPVDISEAVHPGDNVIAVRVNNNWDPTLAPRAGEHVLSGGLFRDVWLVQTDDVHVPWTGTFVTSPQLSADSGQVAVETEVRNAGARDETVTVSTRIHDTKGRVVHSLPPLKVEVAAGQASSSTERTATSAAPTCTRNRPAGAMR
jgi:beta-galactosidase